MNAEHIDDEDVLMTNAENSVGGVQSSSTLSSSSSSSSSSSKMRIDDISGVNDFENNDVKIDSTTASEPHINTKTSSISSVINDSSATVASAVVETSTSPIAPATATTPTTQSMQLNDAFAYLDRVRAEFADQPEIYNKFLQVMREFKSNRYLLFIIIFLFYN